LTRPWATAYPARVGVTEYLVRVAREGLLLAVLVCAPAVLAALAVGFAVSLFQAATQIQEPTLSLAPKLIAVVVALAISAPWIGRQLIAFTTAIFDVIPRIT